MSSQIAVIVSSSDKDVVWTGLFYAIKGTKKQFMDDIRLVLWGPSEKIIAADSELSGMVREYLETGKPVWACRTCADRYGVARDMETLGCTVAYMGSLTAEWFKDGVIPFTW